MLSDTLDDHNGVIGSAHGVLGLCDLKVVVGWVTSPPPPRCRACGVTPVLLPAWCLPRRAYSTEVVGAALLAAAQGAGYARAAAAAGAPTATVRDWLRAVGRSAPALTAQAVTIAGAAGDADACWPRPSLPCSALTSVVNALGAAARAFHLT
jgi:hypothetical protein